MDRVDCVDGGGVVFVMFVFFVVCWCGVGLCDGVCVVVCVVFDVV